MSGGRYVVFIFRGQGQGWGSGVAGLPGPGGRWPGATATGSSMAPSTECKCTGRRVYSSSGYCMERMRCATRLATRYARYSLEPDTRVREPRRPRRRACSHAGCARAHGRSGGSAPWPSGWLAAVQRSRDGDSRARQPRPSANGSRQLRWHGGTHTHGIIKRKSRRSSP